MASSSMSSVARSVSATKCYRLGSNRISRATGNADYNSIVAGVTLWFGVVLDYNSLYCLAANEKETNRGRLLKFASAGWSSEVVILDDFLSFLDEMGDVLIKHISHPSGFKAHLFLQEIVGMDVAAWLNPLKGILHAIFSAAFEGCERDRDKVRGIRCVRQVTTFLKKLQVSRPDLEEIMEEEFLRFEDFLDRDLPLRHNFIDYQVDVFDMKTILDQHMGSYTMAPFVPGHGPGAVSKPSVKSWFEKHTSADTDARIGYLLAHADLGQQQDYLPLITEEKSTRTSRYICVPKTWKKLRGISAEPAELQFWQQGVLRRIDSMFRHDKWWSQRIDLHDQSYSRKLALFGSSTGRYATVDLSAASDSVTRQLVRDLFGNSELGRWLLGSRSTHTLCKGVIRRINKFAPMGSACCFPVECMIFCLAAEVAVHRTRGISDVNSQVRVFGDDIIVPTYAVQELYAILDHLGFSVNAEKSFWQGQFREACGAECWAGYDVAPCRFKTWAHFLTERADLEEISSLTSFANELFDRGLHDTREYLLKVLFSKTVSVSNVPLRVQETIFSSFSGASQTLASPYPTNFNLRKKWSKSLQTTVFRRIVWRERPKNPSRASENTDALDVCEYIGWLLSHQAGVRDFDSLWSKGWIESTGANPFSRLPLGTTMVPTVKWVLPPTYNYLE